MDQKVVLGEQYLPTYVLGSQGIASTATSLSHLLQIMAGASLNVRIRRIRVWQVAVATTAALASFVIIRLSSAGTGGTVQTAAPLVPSDGPSGATGMTLPTVKGIETTSISQQGVYFVQTIPTAMAGMSALLVDLEFDSSRGESLFIPAGVSNGIAIKQGVGQAGASVIVQVDFTEASF